MAALITQPATDPDHAMDGVFRALADPHRRLLLDALFVRDGQTLVELCRALPDLSRFAVMKHLAVLAAAHLVATRRDGRCKLHFLSPVPLRLIHDRWISKYAEPFVQGLVALQEDLEREPAHTSVVATRPA
jgi:DNA-binding transcriptional ArsR family regulator